MVIWPLCSVHEIQREAYVEDYLEEHGPDEDIDLRHVTGDGKFFTDLNVIPAQGLWIRPPTYYTMTNSWRRKIEALRWHPDKPMPSFHVSIPARLARAMEPRRKIQHGSKDMVVYVGVDLHLPIERQLKESTAPLSSVHVYLRRFTGKKTPRDRTRNLWRDIYIYLLSEAMRLSTAEIGKEVFPKDRKASREITVRRSLGKVRKAVAKAGIRSLRTYSPII